MQGKAVGAARALGLDTTVTAVLRVARNQATVIPAKCTRYLPELGDTGPLGLTQGEPMVAKDA